MVLLAGCAPQGATNEPAAAPPAEVSTPAGNPAQSVAAPAATVSFQGTSCVYDGPDTLPAGESLTVTWAILTKAGDIYSLRPILSDTRLSPEELMKSLSGLDAQRPALPAGLTAAGEASSVADRTVSLLVKAPSGPLHGLLYFSCWDSDAAFQVLGPYELK
jgi:hypothetical protein